MQSIRDLKSAMGSEKDHLAHKRMCAVHTVLTLKHPQTQVAEKLDVTVRTLQNWLSRFDSYGADGLRDLPREGRPPNIPRRAVERAAEKLAAASNLAPKSLAREIRASWVHHSRDGRGAVCKRAKARQKKSSPRSARP